MQIAEDYMRRFGNVKNRAAKLPFRNRLSQRVHPGDVNDELLTTTQASKVTLVGEPEVDVALLKLGRRRGANC